ncbi:hypothetical protein PFAG_04429 [Plasmodium falciparum Santa Lucia]|uniref:Uncharacterized protein n=6 Tax=Plasmodium falciparum TaxID=5833 RepID=A0A024W2L6_PLAFA|nr:hypothetical protein PFFVO_04027 [Plasmodium falciparum Vietnam Oak-Knoll (FVO)]ETW34897.1 hypothetical protein PFTANZ_04392 [Plasmodium falciparum Tanzania (2000708)]ETW47680.1 hypothetical protein PFMALIP_04278 [Plasmodium falciparum MaliPS096_E11]ETW54702.1 hypothetical protein PFUGPA_03306 [Plasmodium falciparum Palo Alto/Uganda]ETW59581.1 hypothetical protein PFMC_04393 [Plasmodium falciparum CAMP/Malaysia]EUT81212.1 hypothetical protein PFAG_04429 [Plasmodium falciparum Santa Lucia]
MCILFITILAYLPIKLSRLFCPYVDMFYSFRKVQILSNKKQCINKDKLLKNLKGINSNVYFISLHNI